MILSDLTIVIPTLGRFKYVRDLLRYWQAVDCSAKFILLDGSQNPSELDDYNLSKEFIGRIRLYKSRSIWERMSWCTTQIETRFSIWHADDDFLLPRNLENSLAVMRIDPENSIFSNVRGFDTVKLQDEHSIEDWRKFELISHDARERAISFANNRSNRFYYALWPSEKFKVAFNANAVASASINEEKLIFGDIGFELAGCLLSRLIICENNFLLKRDNMVSQPSVTNMPTVSQYLRGGQNNNSKFNQWVNLFCHQIGNFSNLSSVEVKEIVEEFFSIIVKNEILAEERYRKSLNRKLDYVKLRVLNHKDDSGVFWKLLYNQVKFVFRATRAIKRNSIIPATDWDQVSDLEDDSDLYRVSNIVRAQTKYPKGVIE